MGAPEKRFSFWGKKKSWRKKFPFSIPSYPLWFKGYDAVVFEEVATILWPGEVAVKFSEKLTKSQISRITKQVFFSKKD